MLDIGHGVRWMPLVALVPLACVACVGSEARVPNPAVDAGPTPAMDAAPDPRDPDELIEDPTVYDGDDLEVRTVHLTVTDLDGLADVNDNVPGAEVDVLFQSGSFGAGQRMPNGELRLRGATARLDTQKSYRIKLDRDAGLWRGYRIIHLNKHASDLTRVRQKLSFDYFEEIRHLTSLRMGFVRLFINGKDMGLYTQVERPAKRFLVTHGLDPAGRIYKAMDFAFNDIPAEAWADPVALEAYLEVKANPSHVEFREMLAAVTDESRDIDEVIDTYFHRENYLTWLAVNILMGNFETISRNYLLYSPSDSRRWYFLPWDYDTTWGAHEQSVKGPWPRSLTGVSNWWFPTLHNRFLRKPGNVEALVRMVNHLADEVITPQRTAEMLAQYHDIVRAHVEVPPDVTFLPVDGAVTPEEKMAIFEQEYARIPAQSERLREQFLASLAWPTPVWVWTVQADTNRVRFEWSASFDMQGDGITYDLLVSTSPGFEEPAIVARRTGIAARTVDVALPEGVYFARVIARDDDDPALHWQICDNVHYDPEQDRFYWCALRVAVKRAGP